MDKEIRHERLLDCRYYNGEENPPEDCDSMFWHYERGWANGHHENWECEKEDLRRSGLENFESGDGTPYDLKCLLFNRYCHWSGLFGDAEGFIKWYKEKYQQPRKTNRQRRYVCRKEKLIKECRYYKGEETNPYKNTSDEMTWYYESCWVDQLAASYKNAEHYRMEAGNMFDSIVKNHKVPMSLLGLLLNRYRHSNCMRDEANLEQFKGWLLKSYLKIQ